MTPLEIIPRSVAELIPNPANARTHSPKQIRQIAASIGSFGFNNPILIDRANVIIAGHGRVEAAKLVGLSTVPTVRLDHLSETQKKGYILADNRLAELAGWDDEILAIELQHLTEADLDFEITDMGFETGDIDLLLMATAKPSNDKEDADLVAGVQPGPSVTQVGDLWMLGEHRLLCGDALVAESYATLLEGKAAQMVFTDPPYNVPIGGHVSGMGKAPHPEFAMASGEMSEAQFARFLSTAFKHMAAFTSEGSIHFVCMDWRHLLELLRAGRTAYSELKNLCVWAKHQGGMGSLYRSQHELVAVFKSGAAPHINNVELGRHGRNRTNVWTYAGMNSFHAERAELLAMHPTVKPVDLVADAILDCSHRKGIILDPFAGSGTTLVAAAKTGRRCHAMELSPSYVDIILRRVRAATGIEPVLAATGIPFTALETERSVVGADAALAEAVS